MSAGLGPALACSPKQQSLILKIVEEHKLEKAQVEALAQDRFGKTVKALNKLEASGLIDELLGKSGRNGRKDGTVRSFPQRRAA